MLKTAAAVKESFTVSAVRQRSARHRKDTQGRAHGLRCRMLGL